MRMENEAKVVTMAVVEPEEIVEAENEEQTTTETPEQTEE